MDQCTHEIRAQHWKNIILQCQKRPEGLSAKRWLKENGISEQSYYHWQRKFRQMAYQDLVQKEPPAIQKSSEVTFAEFKVEETSSGQKGDCFTDGFQPAAIIKGAFITVAVAKDISDLLLSRILQAVSNA